jgi:Kef-type K+ transport system membrane component KefB
LQDIWAVLILAFQPNLAHPQISLFVVALGKCVLLGVGSYGLGKYVLTRVFASIAKSPELIVITSLGWCALIAGFAFMLGLSREMGALIAGAVIAAFPYSIFVSAKVLPLRDFFLTLFFVSLGMSIPYPTLTLLLQTLGISIFIFGSRFLSIYSLLSFTGAGRRTAFVTSLNLSQISEFSLVIAALGLSFKHIDVSVMNLVVYTMAMTAIFSSYLIQFSHPLFVRFDACLRRLGFDSKKHTEGTNEEIHAHPIVLLGFHRVAHALVEEITKTEPELLSKILVIDYNKETLQEVRAKGMKGVYGDISHLDTLQHAHVGAAEVILSTIPDTLLKGVTNADLVRFCRSLNPQAFLMATSETRAQSETLLKLGATEVLSPYTLSGQYLCQKLKERN